MRDIKCFAPIIDDNSQILILGSIPSVLSLEKQEYYGNPRNAFWFIMSELFSFEEDLFYEKRLSKLLQNRVALYDVISTCKREGSLDRSIKNASSQNFDDFLAKFPKIKYIFCNGTKAYNEFVKVYVGEKKVFKLPSTSPAYARVKKEDKLKIWKNQFENVRYNL